MSAFSSPLGNDVSLTSAAGIGMAHHPLGDRFTIIRELGRGTSGVVTLCRRREDRQLVAVKEIFCGQDADERRRIFAEGKLMLNIPQHPSIVRIEGVFETRDSVFLVLEYVPEGSMYNVIYPQSLMKQREERQEQRREKRRQQRRDDRSERRKRRLNDVNRLLVAPPPASGDDVSPNNNDDGGEIQQREFNSAGPSPSNTNSGKVIASKKRPKGFTGLQLDIVNFSPTPSEEERKKKEKENRTVERNSNMPAAGGKSNTHNDVPSSQPEKGKRPPIHQMNNKKKSNKPHTTSGFDYAQSRADLATPVDQQLRKFLTGDSEGSTNKKNSERTIGRGDDDNDDAKTIKKRRDGGDFGDAEDDEDDDDNECYSSDESGSSSQHSDSSESDDDDAKGRGGKGGGYGSNSDDFGDDDEDNQNHNNNKINQEGGGKECPVMATAAAAYSPQLGTFSYASTASSPASPFPSSSSSYFILEEQLVKWFTQLANAVAFLHTNGIAHRDIKLDNILVASGHSIVKICDFGVATTLRAVTAGGAFGSISSAGIGHAQQPFGSRSSLGMTTAAGSGAYTPSAVGGVSSQSTYRPPLSSGAGGGGNGAPQFDQTTVGTPQYMPPEICDGRPHSLQCDVWSLGVSFYEMCCRRLPFDATNMLALMHKIIEHPAKPLPSPPFSKRLNAIVLSMLAKDPRQRPTMRQVVQMFAHYRVLEQNIAIARLELEDVLANVQTVGAIRAAQAKLDEALKTFQNVGDHGKAAVCLGVEGFASAAQPSDPRSLSRMLELGARAATTTTTVNCSNNGSVHEIAPQGTVVTTVEACGSPVIFSVLRRRERNTTTEYNDSDVERSVNYSNNNDNNNAKKNSRVCVDNGSESDDTVNTHPLLSSIPRRRVRTAHPTNVMRKATQSPPTIPAAPPAGITLDLAPTSSRQAAGKAPPPPHSNHGPLHVVCPYIVLQPPSTQQNNSTALTRAAPLQQSYALARKKKEREGDENAMIEHLPAKRSVYANLLFGSRRLEQQSTNTVHVPSLPRISNNNNNKSAKDTLVDLSGHVGGNSHRELLGAVFRSLYAFHSYSRGIAVTTEDGSKKRPLAALR